MRTGKRRLIAAFAALGVLASVLVVAPTTARAAFLNPGLSSGSGVAPTVVSGFPSCPQGSSTYTWSGSSLGTQTTPDGAEITLTASTGSLPGTASRYFDFSIAGGEVSQVLVKTDVFIVGFITASNRYLYPDPVAADSRLHPPTDSRNRPFSRNGIRFCYEASISLSGVKFHDLDGDGIRDGGEPGLEGWTITATLGESQQSTVTGPDGSYSFTDLVPGTYEVCEVGQEGWHQSTPEGCHTVSTSADDLDFGNYQNGSISGTKFEDLDADGTRDEGEPGLEGWIITAGEAGPNDTTDGSGVYVIEVGPGTYDVCETIQDDWIASFPDATGCQEVVVSSGQQTTGKDFGNYRAGSISGNRSLNGGAFPSQEVVLFDSTGAQVGNPVYTDSSGNYTFGGLQPGVYTVCTFDAGGTTPSDPDGMCPLGTVGSEVSVVSGQPTEDVDFTDTVTDATVASCSENGATTGGDGDPTGVASIYCETKDGQPLDSIAVVYESGFGIEGFAQRIDLDIVGTPVRTQFVETLDFVPTPRTGDDPIEPVLEYDDGSGFVDAPYCKIPVEFSDLPVVDPSTVLPGDDTLCIIKKTFEVVDPPSGGIAGATYVDIDYVVYWTEDIKRGFR